MYIIFSDLDGTLLDHQTYSYELAKKGILLLQDERVPLVLVSSKTRKEMEIIHSDLNLNSPFIFENGGGIAWKDIGEYEVEYLGMSVQELRERSDFLDGLIPQKLCFITDMAVEEIITLTGLSKEKALMARSREASLPFIIAQGNDCSIEDLDSLNRDLQDKDLMVTRGGRFFHLSSYQANKGNAVRKVIGRLSINTEPNSIVSVGIGDSENDITMLKSVDRPFLVRRHDGSFLKTGISNINVTEGIGPSGFSEVILSIFNRNEG